MGVSEKHLQTYMSGLFWESGIIRHRRSFHQPLSSSFCGLMDGLSFGKAEGVGVLQVGVAVVSLGSKGRSNGPGICKDLQ